MRCMSFLCMIALRNKTVAHTFVSSFDNPSGRLCQERLLRSLYHGNVTSHFSQESQLGSFQGGRERRWSIREGRKEQWRGPKCANLEKMLQPTDELLGCFEVSKQQFFYLKLRKLFHFVLLRFDKYKGVPSSHIFPACGKFLQKKVQCFSVFI